MQVLASQAFTVAVDMVEVIMLSCAIRLLGASLVIAGCIMAKQVVMKKVAAVVRLMMVARRLAAAWT